MHPAWAAISAATVAVAMVATAAFGGGNILQVQSVAPANIEVYSDTDTFAGGDSIVVDDAAVRTQGGEDTEVRRVVKEFQREREFSIFALTWTGDRDIVAYVRAERADGTWSEWYEMEPASLPAGALKAGTDPIFIEPTKRVQVSTGNVDMLEDGRADSEAPTTANDLEAVFIDGGTGTAEGDVNMVADSYTAGMPKVVSRASWGAGSSSNPTYTEPVTAATVHHTAGSNNYTEAQAPGIVRGIWHYHAVTQGWGDMGYNALVDKYGNIYEGRAGGLDRAVQGAHVGGFNANTWGVSVLGDYQQTSPSQQAIQSLGEIIGWKAAVAGFDPMGQSYHAADFNFRGSRYGQGQGAMFPNINAHRDFHYNQCPGDNLYARMDDIRRIAAVKYNALKTSDANPSTTATTTPSQKQSQNQNQNQNQNQKQNQNQTRTETVTNQNGSKTTVTNNSDSETSSADSQLLSDLLAGDATAIATAAGTVAGVILVYAAKQGLLDDAIKNVAGQELIAGLTVKDAAPYIGPALKFVGSSEVADVWYQFEPALGNIVGTGAGIGGSEMVFYESGIGVQNNSGEIFTMVGEIADAWLQQGLDLGPLGLPTSQIISTGNAGDLDEVKMEFEGGAIVYTPSENTVNIITG